MKLILRIILSIVLIIVLIGAGGIFYLTRGLKAGNDQTINGLNLSALNDGIYEGRYEAGRWTNEVSVQIKDHQITKIDLIKDVTFSKPNVADELLHKVLEAQNIDVDVISGSTVTCKAYLKAIENALQQ